MKKICAFALSSLVLGACAPLPGAETKPAAPVIERQVRTGPRSAAPTTARVRGGPQLKCNVDCPE